MDTWTRMNGPTLTRPRGQSAQAAGAKVDNAVTEERLTAMWSGAASKRLSKRPKSWKRARESAVSKHFGPPRDSVFAGCTLYINGRIPGISSLAFTQLIHVSLCHVLGDEAFFFILAWCMHPVSYLNCSVMADSQRLNIVCGV